MNNHSGLRIHLNLDVNFSTLNSVETLRQGWTNLDFDDSLQIGQLRKLWESLQTEILAVIEATNALRESAEYELHTLVAEKPELLRQ